MNVDNKKIPQVNLPRGFAGRITFLFMNRGHSSIYKNMSKALDLKPEDDLLELACGNGYFLKKYASHIHSITGLDLSELSIELATNKNKGRVIAGTAEFVQGDASQLPWEDNKFSVTTAMGSFPGFSKPLDSLKEMYRVLRPGGRAVIGIEWNAEDGKEHSKEAKKYGYQIWSEDQVNTMFREVGFSGISFAYVKGLMMPKAMIARGVKE